MTPERHADLMTAAYVLWAAFCSPHGMRRTAQIHGEDLDAVLRLMSRPDARVVGRRINQLAACTLIDLKLYR